MELNTENLNAGGTFWEPDVIPQQLKQLTRHSVHQMGLKMDNVQKVDNQEEFRENPPNIIIAKALQSVEFVQNYFKKQSLKKKYRYVMGLGVFQQFPVFHRVFESNMYHLEKLYFHHFP